jgi:hypothetical protein
VQSEANTTLVSSSLEPAPRFHLEPPQTRSTADCEAAEDACHEHFMALRDRAEFTHFLLAANPCSTLDSAFVCRERHWLRGTFTPTEMSEYRRQFQTDGIVVIREALDPLVGDNHCRCCRPRAPSIPCFLPVALCLEADAAAAGCRTSAF